MGCSIKRIIKLNEAITFKDLLLFDLNGNNITSTSMYSWSNDGVCWTNWASYESYLNITKHIETDFYLRILIYGSFDKLVIDNCIYKDISISLEVIFILDISP